MNLPIINQIILEVSNCISKLSELDVEQRIFCLNSIKKLLHQASPFVNEPVDCVLWVKSDEVFANDYNPNNVAPPEMELLQHSIREDGYTQPIVSWRNNGCFEVVDGFHRNRVGRECQDIKERILGYLPITIINNTREERGDRIAATIRHNRARGKHKIDAMAEIVIELKRRNWSDKKIGKELGMDPDEVLRLSQITGLAEMFADRSFSEAWEADHENDTVELVENDQDEEGLSPVSQVGGISEGDVEDSITRESSGIVEEGD